MIGPPQFTMIRALKLVYQFNIFEKKQLQFSKISSLSLKIQKTFS